MCPACGYAHCFNAGEVEYNYNPTEPTFKKPLFIAGHIALFKCRLIIEEGIVKFSDDCSHEYAGQELKLQDISQ